MLDAEHRSSAVTAKLLLNGFVVDDYLPLMLGEFFIIRVIYTPPVGTTPGEWPVGIFNYQLDVSPDFNAQTPMTIPMIDASG